MVKLSDVDDASFEAEFSGMSLKFESPAVMEQMKLVCLKYPYEEVVDLVDEWMTLPGMKLGTSKDKEKTITAEQVKHFEARKDIELATPMSKLATPLSKLATPLSKTPVNNRKNRSFQTPAGSARRPPAGQLGFDLGMGSPSLMSGGVIDFSEEGNNSFRRQSAKKLPEKPGLPFCDRTDRGEVVASLGQLPEGMEWIDLPAASAPLRVSLKSLSAKSALSFEYPVMFVKNQEVALALTGNIDQIGDEIAFIHNLSEFSSPATIGEKTVTLGRLLPSLEGGLNVQNLWLQASSTLHNGVKGKLDLDLAKNFSIFPGQVIACRGHGNGKAFVVDEILQGVLPQPVKVELAPTDTLHMLVACGPYSLITEEDHKVIPQPLQQLIKVIRESKPHVVLLMGPFIHPKLAENQDFLLDGTLEDYFKSMATLMFEEIVGKLNVPVVIVPSAGQLVGMPIYPVPPFSLADCVKNPNSFSGPDFAGKIIFAPEPALLNVNGVIVGLTSTDVVFHLCQKENSRGFSEGKLPRMAGHLLQQQSFYPLYPTEMAADMVALEKFAKIRFRPHILITPSELKGFVKTVHDTVCINPERLTKAFSGGTFARIFIPTVQHDLKSSAGEKTSLEGRIVAQIVRI